MVVGGGGGGGGYRFHMQSAGLSNQWITSDILIHDKHSTVKPALKSRRKPLSV